ncbi:ABC transporter ATP-binding protein [Thermococcus sp.]
MEYAILTKDLTKYYGKLLAVDHVNLRVPFNTIYGFLGPNGAGKTTTIRMLCGLTNVSSGDAMVNGHSVRKEAEKVKASIGVVQDISNLYPELTCFDNLMFCAEMHGVPKRLRKERVLELLAFFGLEDRKNEKFANLSKGLKRRLTIAAALVHKPKILLLDEPTLGLDVKSRRKMWKLIQALKEEGLTIFLTSHNVYEVSRLSERVAVINRGRIVAEGEPSELRKLVPYDETIELSVSDPKKLIERLRDSKVIVRAYLDKDSLRIVARNPLAAVEQISRILREEGIDVNFMSLRSADMEEVFLKIVEGEGIGGSKQSTLHSQEGH